jgi:hypothetical protein
MLNLLKEKRENQLPLFQRTRAAKRQRISLSLSILIETEASEDSQDNILLVRDISFPLPLTYPRFIFSRYIIMKNT